MLLVSFVPATMLQGGARAQSITVDGRLSPAQTLAGPSYAIGAGLGRQVGGNLFHSFGAFGLNGGETATFSGPPSVGNVIGRVTGGAASSINGGISSTIPGANLYLVNPAGVVFGPNAVVDVSGSFHASSADYVRMQDGARFQATNPDASTLSAAPPEAFGFLSASPRPVTINGAAFRVASGRTLGMVGGDVTISNGVLVASAGTVHIASAAGPGEVPVNPRAGPAPTVARSGSVRVANGSAVVVNGGAGSVFIRAGELAVSASQIQANGAGPGPGGVISLQGDRVVVVNSGANIEAFSTSTGRGASISISTAAGGAVTLDAATVGTAALGTGDGGAFSINTGTLTLQNGALALSRTVGVGNGGPISVMADSVLLDGAGTVLASLTTGAGRPGARVLPGPAGAGGTIRLTGGTLRVQNDASIETNTFSSGMSGSINVAMTENVEVSTGSQIISTSTTGGAADQAGAVRGGDLGAVTLSAGRLTLSHGGSVRSVASASGNAGDVTLRIGGALTIDGANNAGSVNGVSSEGSADSSGSAGAVRVSAGSVSVLNGGFINSNTRGTGAASSVAVTTPGALLLDGAGTEIGASALDTRSGNAGTVTVSAGAATVQNGAQIASSTYGPGRSGDVSVEAGSVSVLNGSVISSNTYSYGTGAGGSVRVVTPGTLLIDGSDEFITEIGASAYGQQSGDAGTVTVTAGAAVLQRVGRIASLTYGPGRGGDITVNAGTLTLARAGAIDNQTYAAGNAGDITLNIDDALTIDGAGGRVGTGVSSEAFSGSGSAGVVRVSAGTVSVSEAIISSSTRGTGAGGSVLVTTPGALLLDGRNMSRTSLIGAVAIGPQSGDAGTVAVNAGSITVRNNARISSSSEGAGRGGGVSVTAGTLALVRGGGVASTTSGSGNAGEVALNVRGALTIDGAGDGSGNGGSSTGVASSSSGGSGSAGTVQVSAGSVAVLNGGLVTSSTSGTGAGGSVLVTTPGLLLNGVDAQIGASALGSQSGDAGTVTVNAGNLTIQGGAQIASSTNGTGRGGNVSVTAASSIQLSGVGPQINATSTGSGDAGSITLSAPRVTLRDGAGISTGAQAANGGNITIGPGDLLYLQRSSITTSVGGALGNGGNITVDPRFVVLDRSLIQANAVGGNGGNVLVRADQLVQSAESAVTASSQRGVSGEIFIAAQPLNLNGSLVVLASDLRSAAALLREGCAARGASPRSSLVMAGRGGQRQSLETMVPALYFAGRPVRGEGPALAMPATPEHVNLNLSGQCG